MRRSDYYEIYHMLRVFYDPDDCHIWMKQPHPQLENRRPVDCLPSEVRRVIDRLESGAYL